MTTLYTSSGSGYHQFRDEVDNEVLCRLPLAPGTKYLVQAHGQISGPKAQATLTLTLFDWLTEVELASERVDLLADYETQMFSLMLAAEVSPATGSGSPPPADAAAVLSIRLRGWLLKLGGFPGLYIPGLYRGGPRVDVYGGQIFALAVDEIVQATPPGTATPWRQG